MRESIETLGWSAAGEKCDGWVKRDAHQVSVEIALSVHTRALLDIDHSYLFALFWLNQLFAASPPPPPPLCYNLLKCTRKPPQIQAYQYHSPPQARLNLCLGPSTEPQMGS